MKASAGLLAILALALAEPANAWSRPAHMVTAAIAYEELASDPKLRATLIDLLEAHPDRGPFEVAIDRSVGEPRQRRIFYQCARWADDARGTPFDHPTWHYAARPIVAADFPAERPRPEAIDGSAIEAFTLNIRVLGDRRASKAERAIALCWVMHLVGDIHQPLHTAQLFSKAFPDGDELGSKQFIREQAGDMPVTLHWYWDDRVHRSGTQESVEKRAADLVARYPRIGFKKIEIKSPAADFASWAHDESHPLAVSTTYGLRTSRSIEANGATVADDRYAAASLERSEQRVALAGYRLADLLRASVSDD